MKPIRVNGVLVHCGHCVNFELSPEDDRCKDCWNAIFHNGDISEVDFEDISFYPRNKDRFFAMQKLLGKFKDQIDGIKSYAESLGIRFEDLVGQFSNPEAMEIWIDGIR